MFKKKTSDKDTDETTPEEPETLPKAQAEAEEPEALRKARAEAEERDALLERNRIAHIAAERGVTVAQLQEESKPADTPVDNTDAADVVQDLKDKFVRESMRESTKASRSHGTHS